MNLDDLTIGQAKELAAMFGVGIGAVDAVAVAVAVWGAVAVVGVFAV